MKRLKGPEIKMPKVKMKVPKPLVDLYRDLDERHLLPAVVILLVAIIAIPLLLGGSTDSDSGAPTGAAEAGASAAPQAKASAVLVAKASPRLRDYERRLDHLQPKDPFEPKYTESESEGGGSDSSESAEGGATEESTTATVEIGEGGAGGGTSPGPGPSSPKPEITYLTYAIDVKVTSIASDGNGPNGSEWVIRESLPPQTMLPSRSTPALTYIGLSRDGEKAMMLVSDEVTALAGNSKCVLGAEHCQLLALEPGKPETVVFGPQDRTFRIELLKIELDATDKRPNRVKLGAPQNRVKPGAPQKRTRLGAPQKRTKPGAPQKRTRLGAPQHRVKVG
jgi:hypothetical protein